MRRQARPYAVSMSVLAATVLLALTAGACTAGTGATPDDAITLTIAVDLPFEGAARDVSEDTYDALYLYLEQVNFKAGRYSIELVRRDNSTAASGGWNEASCAKNAQDHVATVGQVAVIGTFNNGCTKVEAPVLNNADGGPMLLVSHANTALGLTAEAEPDEPQRYFPSGQRSFARVITNEAAQGVAAAQFAAKKLEVSRCLVLNDGEPDGDAVAQAFTAEARRQGIEVVGEESWRRGDASYVPLFNRARAGSPDCVVLGGHFDNNGSQLVRDKVAVLGDNEAVKLLATDGFVGYPEFAALDEAAGSYLTFPGLTTEGLAASGSAGSRLIADFAAEYGYKPRSESTSYPLYAVQALQVILAAIERSDGTRKGVRDAVFGGAGITVPASTAILGRDLTIDPATGDVVAGDITIQRIQDGRAVSQEAWRVS